MSVPTQPAFVHYGTWDDTTRKHPAMKWMEEHTITFDEGEMIPKWYSEDFTLYKADGTIVSGREKAIAALRETYGTMTSYFHEPYYIVCTEITGGWAMIGQAKLFGNLNGNPAPGEAKVKDLQGREWDMGIPAAFHFQYLKDAGPGSDDGIVLKKMEVMADSGVPMGIMLKRGVIQPKDLGL